MNNEEKPDWTDWGLPVGFVLIMIIALILALTGSLPD
jgi:hypothetical protein